MVEWNFLPFLKAFAVGGVLCVIGQLLIDRTQLTPARILVGFVVRSDCQAGRQGLIPSADIPAKRCPGQSKTLPGASTVSRL